MTVPSAHHPGHEAAEPFPVGYKSAILEQFVESLIRLKDGRLLDAGPVCQENIRFFARRISRHYACDMYIRLHRALSRKPEPGNFCRELDYPPHSFDGIQLWDLIDHLDDSQARQLVERCFKMLRSTGLLMLIALEKKPEPMITNTFVVGRDYRLDLRPQSQLELPWYGRHNRALMTLLAEFNNVKLYRYRNGLREFLCVKPVIADD